MKKEIIDIPGVAKLKQLSRAVKFGSTVYVAGTIGKPMKGGEMCSDITNQAKIAMENLKMVLENAGTSIENVLKMTCYLKDMKDKADFDKIFILYFPKDPPARACFAVRDLGEGIKLEIETIASIPD